MNKRTLGSLVFALGFGLGISACTPRTETPEPTQVVTEAPTETPTVAPSPTPSYECIDGKVAFSAYDGDRQDIWVQDDCNLVRLTDRKRERVQEEQMSWSDNGSRLAFVTSKVDFPTDFERLAFGIINEDYDGSILIQKGAGFSNITWIDNNNFLYLAMPRMDYGIFEIRNFNIDIIESSVIVPNPQSEFFGIHSSLSPNKERLLVDYYEETGSNAEYYMLNRNNLDMWENREFVFEGQKLTQFPNILNPQKPVFVGNSEVLYPVYETDGQEVNTQIQRIDTLTGQMEELGISLKGYTIFNDISSDGDYLVSTTYLENREHMYQIIMTDIETGEQRNLFPDSNAAFANWSPGGNQVVFIGESESRPEYYVMDVKSGDLHTLPMESDLELTVYKDLLEGNFGENLTLRYMPQFAP